ncbi:hypothetical protein BH24ACT15_BH24ACT15_34970 [soil metagenome]
MNGPDEQALILGSLVGLSAASVAGVALFVWFFRR